MASPITPFVDKNQIVGDASIYNVMSYGATGNGVIKQDGAQGSSPTDFTSASGTFTSADVGKVISIVGGGDSSGISNLTTTIAAVISATEITLATGLSYAVSAATYVYGTDDTAAIQAAINAVGVASYGIVYFPQGVYIVNGPFVNPTQENSQLTLPRVSYYGPAVNMRLEGPLTTQLENGGAGTLAQNGAIIFSTIVGTGGTSGPGDFGQSVLSAFGYPPGPLGSFTNLQLEILNLTFFTVNNPKINALNLYFVSTVICDNLTVQPGVAWGRAGQATGTSYGIIAPTNQNGAFPYFGKIVLYGFNTGISLCEHAFVLKAEITLCKYAVEIRGSGYPIQIVSLDCEWNTYNINVVGAAQLKVDLMHYEHGPSPYTPIAEINDPNNYLYDSHITYTTNGGEFSFTAIGAAGAFLELLGTQLTAPKAFTGQQYFAMATLTDAPVISWNLATQQIAQVTLSGNRTLGVPQNQAKGARYALEVIQDGVGSRTLAYNPLYRWPGGTAPVLSTAPGAIDKLEFMSDGTNMLGSFQLGYTPAVFSPASISGLTLWFDASNAGSITQSGGSVSQWKDLSGYANNLTQATGSAQPTIQTAAQNGLNTLRFTAANSQKMSLASLVNVNSAYSIFVVARRGGPAGANNLELFNNSGSAQSASLQWYAADDKIYIYDSAGYLGSPVEASTAYNQIDANITSASAAINLNGANVASGALTAFPIGAGFDTIGYGDGEYCNGEIAEVILYNSVLAPSDAAALRSYLKTKWGTP